MGNSLESSPEIRYGGFPIPDWLVELEEFGARYESLKTVDDARSFLTDYLISLSSAIVDSQSDVVNDLAKNQLKTWLYKHAPTGLPTTKEHHPSLKKFKSRDVLVVAMEETLGPENLTEPYPDGISLQDRSYKNIVKSLPYQRLIARIPEEITTVA